MTEIIARPAYLSFLERNIGGERVKILYGARGAGKTTILKEFIHSLLRRHISESQIFYLDFSLPATAKDKDAIFLELSEKAGQRPAFVILDGIQMLPNFEAFVDRLFMRRNFDIYLAGSGMGPLTEPLMKLLPGRCVIKRVYPYSLRELYAHQEVRAPQLTQFLSRSTMPAIAPGESERRQLEGLVSALLLHDVLYRQPAIRPRLLERFMGLISEKAGQVIDISEITSYLGRLGRPLLQKTLHVYVDALDASGLLIVSPLMDMTTQNEKGGKRRKALRFYFTDPAMIGLSAVEKDAAPRLMDAIAVELMRRHGAIACAETDGGAVDFLTGTGSDLPTLWQYIPDEHDPTASKKISALSAAPDTYRKVLLTMHPEGFSETPFIVKDLLAWFMGR